MAAVPKELIEAEIFGFEKVFTSAIKSTIATSRPGELFLDEICP